MKSLIYHGPGDIRYENREDAGLTTAGSAVVRITAASICGSDLHPYHVDRGATGYGIGHESVGEVMEVGSEVHRFLPGQRVLIPGSIGCGDCAQCNTDEVMLCDRFPYPRVFGQGIPGIEGCQAEAVEVPVADANLRPLGHDISDELGVMLTDTLPTAWYAAKKARIAPGSSVAVIGLGAVGSQAILAAYAMGAERVVGIDLLPQRRDAAAALGAITVRGDATVEQVRDQTGGYGVDAVIDANGSPQTVQLAMDLARKGGKLSIIGVPDSPLAQFTLRGGLAKNIELALSSCSVQAQQRELLDALRSGRIDADVVEGFITHRLPLAEGPRAYELFDARRDGVMKVVLTP